MEPIETIIIENSTVSCDGGGGQLGHPRVYLTTGTKDRIQCPYCGRLYVLGPDAKTGTHGH